MADQKAETIAKHFVEGVVCRHRIPEQLLSDRGPNFLSGLIQEVCKLLGVNKVKYIWIPSADRWTCGEVQFHTYQYGCKIL